MLIAKAYRADTNGLSLEMQTSQLRSIVGRRRLEDIAPDATCSNITGLPSPTTPEFGDMLSQLEGATLKVVHNTEEVTYSLIRADELGAALTHNTETGEAQITATKAWELDLVKDADQNEYNLWESCSGIVGLIVPILILGCMMWNTMDACDNGHGVCVGAAFLMGATTIFSYAWFYYGIRHIMIRDDICAHGITVEHVPDFEFDGEMIDLDGEFVLNVVDDAGLAIAGVCCAAIILVGGFLGMLFTLIFQDNCKN